MKRSIWDQSYINLRVVLKAIRLASNLTQTELAVKLDKPQSFIAKYERGDRNLDFIEVIQVCETCGKDIQFLLDELRRLQ